MIKLTATQLGILSTAHDRDDGLAVRPEPLKPAAATKMAAKLVEKGLCRQVRAKAEMPIWREDEQGKAFSLKILKAGRAVVAEAGRAETHGSTAAPSPVPFKPGEPEVPTPALNGAGSKRDLIVAMMQRQEGASIDDLMSTTGWLPHTTRAALSGLRKKGFTIVRSRDPNVQISVYKIAGQLAAVAAA